MLLWLSIAYAFGTIQMRYTGQKESSTPAFGYTTCHYEQTPAGLDPLRIRIVVQGAYCPWLIKYDPVSGTWSE